MLSDKPVVKHILDCRSHSRILSQQSLDQIRSIHTEVSGRLEFARFDPDESVLDCSAFKRWLARHHSKHYAAEGPQVSLQTIWLVQDHFRANVVRSATQCLSFLGQITKLHGQTEVYDFDNVGLSQQYV